MATQAIHTADTDDEAELRAVVAELTVALKEERKAQERLIATVRRMERAGERQRAILGY